MTLPLLRKFAASLPRSGLDAMGRAARQQQWHHRRCNQPMERPMPQPNDLSRSLCRSRTRCNIDRGDRDGPGELAGRRHRARNRTPTAEEARRRSGSATAASASLAEGSHPGGTHASSASPLPMRPVAMASGWRAGCGRTTSKPMSSIRRVSPSRASTGGRRRIGSILTAQARLPGLAAWRAEPLHHGCNPHPRG